MIERENRYNIIIPSDSGYSLDALERQELSELSHLIRMGSKYSWTLQTFYYLKKLGLAVGLSHGLDSGCVNIAHGNFLRSAAKKWNYFVVSIQGDYPHFPLAHYHVVQNQDQVIGRSSFMPLWPQIGQIPRNPERRDVIRVAFQGRIAFTDLDPERLNADLNPHGIEFVSLENWQDLSSVDLLVGIRHYGKKLYRRKPASKLINAWNANIPFIGGWDSAYSFIGTPGQDYLRVASHDELIANILDLKENQALYDKLVAAGSERVKNFTTDVIARNWAEMLETKVYPIYQNWRRRPRRAMCAYELHLLYFWVSSSVKRVFRTSYRFPVIKRLRDLYYDPVK